MSGDIVAELDQWMAEWPRVRLAAIERARDEIVALREARHECERQFQAQVAEVGRLLDHVTCPQVRDEALEEAARLVEEMPIAMALGVAAAIRALKKKPA